MNLERKKKVSLTIAFLTGIIGVGNIAVGAWSLLTVNSMNITDRISTLGSLIDSIDPSLVGSPTLSNQISNLETVVVEDLNVFVVQSRNLNVIPAYLIFQGIIFVAMAVAVYLTIPKKESAQ